MTVRFIGKLIKAMERGIIEHISVRYSNVSISLSAVMSLLLSMVRAGRGDVGKVCHLFSFLEVNVSLVWITSHKLLLCIQYSKLKITY